MLYLYLKPIFEARGIEKPYAFLAKAGFNYHAAKMLLNSQTRVFRLDYIERLCEILNCEPNDLLLWKPDANKVIAHNNPLYKMAAAEIQKIDLKETLHTLPYKELKQLTHKMNVEINDIP